MGVNLLSHVSYPFWCLWIVVPHTTISSLLQELWPHWGAWRDVEPSWGVFGAFCKRSSLSWSFFTSPLCLMYLPLKSHSLDWFHLLFLDGEVFVKNCAHVIADSSAFIYASYLEPSDFHSCVSYTYLFQFVVPPYVHIPWGKKIFFIFSFIILFRSVYWSV